MADNTQIPRSSTDGDKIATEELAGIKMQRVKLVTGAAGTQDDVSPSSPVPVSEQRAAVSVIDSDVDVDSNAAGTSLDIGTRETVSLFIEDAGGATPHTTHVITVQGSPNEVTWFEITDILLANIFKITGLGTMTGRVGNRYVRSFVKTPEGGASTVHITIEAK